MNVENYIGIPFLKNGNNRNGCDCWKLIVMVYREQLGIDLPDYAEIFVDDSLASLKKVARTMKEERLKWQQVQTPIPYDVILLRVGGLVCHAGLVIDRRRMLHIMDGVNSTVEEFASPQWKQRVEGFYRWIIDKS